MTWARFDDFFTLVEVEDDGDEDEDEDDEPAAESVVWLVPVDDPSPGSG